MNKWETTGALLLIIGITVIFFLLRHEDALQKMEGFLRFFTEIIPGYFS